MEDRKELEAVRKAEKGLQEQAEKSHPLVRLICLGFTIFTVWEVSTLSLPPLMERVIFVTFGLILCFLLYPFSSRVRGGGRTILDFLLIAVSAAVCIYFVAAHDDMMFRLGSPTRGDMVAGALLIILVVEGTRRSIGWALCLVALGALAYSFFGQYLPMALGQHGGYEIERIVTQTSLSTEGIFGVATYVIFSYVFLFIFFGNILAEIGGTVFVIDMARALFGSLTGGPAKISVLSSGLMGTISGSAVANVMVDGWVTIPLMKQTGFRGHMAAAVEAVTSTGGALMPPVMGAAAFIMAEYLAVPYISVAKAAILPAVLYYLALFCAIHFYARQHKLFGLPRHELPRVWDVLKSKGYVFLIPLGTIIYFLMAQYSPNRAVLFAILGAFGVSLFSGATRLGPARAVRVCEKSARDAISLACACACVGIVVAQVMMSGLGLRLPDLIIQLAGGSLLFTLILVMVSSLILGMGLPTTVCYILLATLIAPTLIKMGVLPMAAHLFIFYFGMLSMVTPPVAMAAYAAGTLAGANIMTTGWAAWKLALVGFLLPYAFVYGPELLMMGRLLDIAVCFFSGVIGVFFLSAAVIGYLKREVTWPEKALFLAGACLLIKPGWITDLIGLSLLGLGLFSHLHSRREAVALKALG